MPRVEAPFGASLRVRIRARDVMLATRRPEAISALNILEARFLEARGDGVEVEATLAVGSDRLLARITRRSLLALGLAPGSACFALIKTVAVGRGDVGVFEERDA